MNFSKFRIPLKKEALEQYHGTIIETFHFDHEYYVRPKQGIFCSGNRFSFTSSWTELMSEQL